jgi:hypothetical protein
VNPADGRSCPEGAENRKVSPDARGKESVIGLNDSFPENAMAVTIVGEARKFMVRRFPSLRDLKFRLKLVKIAIKMGVIGEKKIKSG